jgi:hypothetical protein
MSVPHAAAQCPAANRKPDYMPYLFLKRSTRPPVSTSFCLPVKKGWHFEHMSTLRFSLVEPVSKVSPHAQRTVHCVYFGWMFSFISYHLFQTIELYYITSPGEINNKFSVFSGKYAQNDENLCSAPKAFLPENDISISAHLCYTLIAPYTGSTSVFIAYFSEGRLSYVL